MTPKEFKDKMQAIYEEFWEEKEDEERCHIAMDDLMCKLLRELGYGDTIDIFDDTPKWYA